MMVAIFTAMALALAASWRGARRLALVALIACFALSLGEFLYEVYSPVDGFRLPWLQAVLGGGRPA